MKKRYYQKLIAWLLILILAIPSFPDTVLAKEGDDEFLSEENGNGNYYAEEEVLDSEELPPLQADKGIDEETAGSDEIEVSREQELNEERPLNSDRGAMPNRGTDIENEVFSDDLDISPAGTNPVDPSDVVVSSNGGVKDGRWYIERISRRLTISDNVTKIYRGFSSAVINALDGIASFDIADITTIVIPDTVTEIEEEAFKDFSGLTSFELEEPNAYFAQNGGVLIYKGDTGDTYLTVIACPANNTGDLPSMIGNVTIDGKKIGKIAAYAFNGCTGINGTFALPETVTEIGNYAFYNCKNITGELEIPENVTSIGNSAFEGCTGITGELHLDKATNLKDVHSFAFKGCTGIRELYLPDSSSLNIQGNAFDGTTALSTIFYIATSAAVDYVTLEGNWNNGLGKNQSLQQKNCYPITLGTINVIFNLMGGQTVAMKESIIEPWTNIAAQSIGPDEVGNYIDNIHGGLSYPGRVLEGWDKYYNSPEPRKTFTSANNLVPGEAQFLHLRAVWKEAAIIKFDTGGGRFLQDHDKYTKTGIIVKKGESAGDDWPGNPVRGNDEFLGWFDETASRPFTTEKAFKKDTKVTKTGEMILYAKWQDICTISFIDIDGSVIYSIENVSSNETNNRILKKYLDDAKAALDLLPPKGERVYFDHWNRYANGDPAGRISTGSQVTSSQGVMLIYAVYTRTYKISYHCGYSGGSDPPDRIVYEGYTLEPLEEIERDGYAFNGWYEDPNDADSERKYKLEDIRKDYDLYGRWIKFHTIAFNYEDGKTPVSTSEHILDGNKVGAAANRKPKSGSYPGHMFMGWYLKKGGEGTALTENYVINDDINVYAFWEKSYQIVFHSLGGSYIADEEVIGDQQIYTNAPKKEGYIFNGWAYDEEGTEFFEEGTRINDIKERLDKPVDAEASSDLLELKLYASWTKEDDVYYTVNFESNGGTEIESQSVKKGEFSVKPEDPIRKGYYFRGWYRDKNYRKLWDFETPITDDTTIYAKWISAGEPGMEDDEFDKADKALGRRVVKIALVPREKVDISTYFKPFITDFEFYDNDNTYATSLSKKGILRAKHEGTSRITGFRESGTQVPVVVKITVVEQSLGDILLEEGKGTVSAVDYLLEPRLKPDKWSIKGSPLVAQIHPTTGLIKIHKGGSVTVIAHYSNVKISSKLRIAVPVLPKPTIAMITGASRRIKVKGVNKKHLTYTSLSEDIVTVDEKGRMTALSAGSANVTISVNGGGTSVLKVIVKPPVVKTPVIVVRVGRKKKARIRNTKVKNIFWESQNEEICIVDEKGFVFGLSPGKTTITTNAGGVTSTCRVVVAH